MHWLAGLVVAALVTAEITDEQVRPFAERELRFSSDGYRDHVFRYRLLAPEPQEPDARYPLVVFLHGAGERGDDNRLQLKYLPLQMAEREWRERFPCYLLAPQCPTGKWWARLGKQPAPAGDEPAPLAPELTAVEQMLESVLAEFPIDEDRVYLTGLSMGGFGSWHWAAVRPERFAAVVPICGGGDPRTAPRLVKLPLWAVHGGADPVVPVARSREMIEALKAAGGAPHYTELDGVGHDSWTPAYGDPAGVLAWMFSQRRASP